MTSAAVKGRGALQDFTYPGVGSIEVPRAPFRFSGAKVEIPRPAPGLGQHNSEVLREVLGYSEQEISTLIEDGVLMRQEAEKGALDPSSETSSVTRTARTRRNLPRHKPSLNTRSARRTGSSNRLRSSIESPRTKGGYAADTVSVLHGENEGLHRRGPENPQVRWSKGFRTAGFGDARPD